MDRAPTGSTIDLEFDDSAFAQASPFRRRSYTAVFDIAVILFALLATLGVYRAITVNRSLPPPIVDYNPTVNFLLLTDQHDTLLAQLQMVARLDDLNAQHALSEIVRISGKLGRYETQAWAYRRMLARTRGDLRLPTLLASAILDQSTRTPAELAEARQLSEEVLDATPEAAKVYVNLGSVHYFEGERDRALASWQRAFELEPGGQAVFTDTINRRHPAERDAS